MKKKSVVKSLSEDVISAHADEYVAETLDQGAEVPFQEETAVAHESLSRRLIEHFYMYVLVNENLQPLKTISKGNIAMNELSTEAVKAYADEYITQVPYRAIKNIQDAAFVETHREAFKELLGDFWLYVQVCRTADEARGL